jgi:hypothetical protein
MKAGGHGQVRARAFRGGLVRLLRAREDAAALALLVQVAAFVVVPGLHLVNHRPDHTHGPGGVTHRHEVPGQPNGAPDPAPAHDGQGSLLHFGLAVSAQGFFTWALAFTLIVALLLWSPAERVSARALFDVSAPRGPPVAI